MENPAIKTKHFSHVVNKLREFCLSKGFREVHTQDRITILAACEDPSTISTFEYPDKEGVTQVFPLPQTGQMHLEYELLTDQSVDGYFCVSTSYRNEKNIVPGRHLRVFPMFEFELKGGFDALLKFETELLKHLGYDESQFVHKEYTDVMDEYGVELVSSNEEGKLYDDCGSVVFLKNFPNHTSPFWNMAQNADGTGALKVDVILSGHETIGSAERSTDKKKMRDMFDTISDGGYKNILYDTFGKERVDKEFDNFTSLEFFPRSGGGIGLFRLVSSMLKEGLLKD
uniref:Aminoacyl-tRNA synthetase class II (D/K/N) domain-containing protein n=1 Tax=viral metagenome TaxID=1070528 RepID=A0A6C0EAQ7_9ZZZZ